MKKNYLFFWLFVFLIIIFFMTFLFVAGYRISMMNNSHTYSDVIENINTSNLVKGSKENIGYQIDLLSTFITIFCAGMSIMVAIFAIITTIRSYRIEERFRATEDKVSGEIKAMEKIVNNDHIRELINNVISEKELIYSNVEKVMNEHFKKEILSQAKAINIEFLGASKFKFQCYESIMRRVFKSITNSISKIKYIHHGKPVNLAIINKENFDRIFDQFSTDLLIVNYFYSGNINLIEKGLSDYRSTSKNPQFLEVLKDLKTQYNDNPDLYPLFIDAIKIAQEELEKKKDFIT